MTAGESHGPALVAILEGVPAGVEVTSAEIGRELARRRLGYGRGARMSFEQDEVEIVGGIRHGVTLGSPVAIRVGNTEWPKWETVMAADPVDPDELAGLARNAPLTRPRPGHADLAGMQKYGHTDARPILERASARETAARVAVGTVAKALLRQALGVEIVSHVVELGPVAVKAGPGAAPRRRRAHRRRPAALPRPGGEPADGRGGRRGQGATPTLSAASSRCWPTAYRRGSAATCSGTASSTRGWPPR